MNLKKNEVEDPLRRRARLHEILIALINQQKDLELMEDGVHVFDIASNHAENYDSSRVIERNQRIIKKYQSLVRSAIALDALLESEQYEISDGKIS